MYHNMEKPATNMNQENMLRYYRKFDPIEKKYRVLLQRVSDYDKGYHTFYQYENNRYLSDLTKKEFGDIFENLKLVYANEYLTEEIIEIFDLIYDKVINQYLNIDGMERLFSENYINFEWEMHLGIDYKSHSMKFYRDHFIHQVRDAFCMDMMLENGYAKEIAKILGNEGSSKISRYVCKMLNQQMDQNDELVTKYVREKRENFYLENIIYMSSYMCALFHDIGYPEVANMHSGRNIRAYIANVYNFGSGHIEFDRIITILQNSLLFRVVSPEEIRKRIENAEIDHGAVSALMFLLHFYENGAIWKLEPYKKCAVEIAGLAIYNHTNTYEYALGDENALYQKNVFVLNPISHLLRICDDLQEWGRIYFEISPNSNIIYCSSCHTPIVRREWKKEKDVYYLCNCNGEHLEESGVFGTVFRRDSFPYRRLYNVTVCKEVRFVRRNGKHIFELDYDLERLLNVAYINPSYAKYRIKELNQLKKLFVRQDVKEMTYLDYFMTSNIILIKAQIIGKYLLKRKDLKRYLQTFFVKIYKNLWTSSQNTVQEGFLHKRLKLKADKIYEKISGVFSVILFPEEVKTYLNDIIPLYIYIWLAMRIGMKANAKQNEEICKQVESLWENFSNDSRLEGDALLLVKDCFRQAARLYQDISVYDFYPEKYFEQFCSEKGMEHVFFRFAHSDNYVPVRQRKPEDIKKLDAYTDLYIFKIFLK